MTSTNYDVRRLYLDLLRRNLTRTGMREQAPPSWPLRRRLLLKAVNTVEPMRRGMRVSGRSKRELGLDWPAEAETMIGMKRLTSLQQCIETVLEEDIPGDLIECGVWRGGAAILMRAVLAAYGDTSRNVWLADSFQGVPRPDAKNFQADKGIRLDLYAGILAVSKGEVEANFERYGLLDDRVRILPGWFKETLHKAPVEQLSVLRLDGDLYESTIQALDALYPRLSLGGFCIIDDYPIEACKQACTDYRTKHGITAEIIDIDGTGVLWRK